jgi:SAM-dependent methyltransferase
MKEYLIDDLYEKESGHWWHIGKRKIVAALLQRHARGRDNPRILEIGCGSGRMMEELSLLSADVSGIDISPKAVEICRRKGLSVREGDFMSVDAGTTYDIIVCLDAIEHFDDDGAALGKIRSLLMDGGICLLSVPAYSWLWSDWDRILSHKRRYSRRTLKDLAARAGFTPLMLSYSNMFIFPAAAAFRLVKKALRVQPSGAYTEFFVLPPILNSILIFLYAVESILLTRISLPFGLSLVSILRNKRPSSE